MFHAWPCSGWGLPAAEIAPDTGALLPHRFTLACAHTERNGPSAVCSLLPGPTGRPALTLVSTLTVGAPTFLDEAPLPAPRRGHPADSPSPESLADKDNVHNVNPVSAGAQLEAMRLCAYDRDGRRRPTSIEHDSSSWNLTGTFSGNRTPWQAAADVFDVTRPRTDLFVAMTDAVDQPQLVSADPGTQFST